MLALHGQSVKENCKDLKNEQLLVATHSRRVLLGIGYRLNAKQNFDWLLSATFSHGFPGVPETANADGHQSPSMWT